MLVLTEKMERSVVTDMEDEIKKIVFTVLLKILFYFIIYQKHNPNFLTLKTLKYLHNMIPIIIQVRSRPRTWQYILLVGIGLLILPGLTDSQVLPQINNSEILFDLI